MNKLQLAQDVFKNYENFSSRFLAGFNSRVHGDTDTDYRDNAEERFGKLAASELILDGQIYCIYKFSESTPEHWWTIKVYKEGNAWCCVGLGFTDLQSSSNYAFGCTREEAINSYGALYTELVEKQ